MANGRSRRDLVWRVLENLPFAFQVIPYDESVQVAASCEKHPAAGRFAQTVSEPNVLLGLRPAGDQEHVDRDLFLSAQHAFSHGYFFGPWMRWVEHVKRGVFEVSRWQSVGDQ